MRVLGWIKREAGSVKPSGNKALATSRSVGGMATVLIACRLLVPVIAFAVVGATALNRLGAAGLVSVDLARLGALAFHLKHGSHSIN